MFKAAGVISTRNQQEFIEESIRSLHCQVDELIVVDDASTDQTLDVIKSISDINFSLIEHPRSLGVSTSYNEAIEATTSELIFIQGGDDVSLPSRREVHLDHFSSEDVVLSYSVPTIIGGNGSVLPPECGGEFLRDFGYEDNLAELLYRGNFICAPSVAIQRTKYLELGGFHPGSLHLQDYGLWLKMAEIGQFKRSQIPLVKYRKHANNLSRESVLTKARPYSRKEIEYDFLFSSFFENAKEHTLFRLAKSLGIYSLNFKDLDRDIQIAKLQLLHPHFSQRRRALATLFNWVGNSHTSSEINEVGITVDDLENLSALGQ